MIPLFTPSSASPGHPGRLARRKSLLFWRNLAVSCTLLFAALVPNLSKAQTSLTIGTGTSTTSQWPIYTCYGYNYSQQTYLASEIVAAGAGAGVPGYISSISFNPTTITASSFATYCKDWVVYMGNTTKSTFSSSSDWVPFSSLTKVYDGTVTPTGTGWFKITFATPFYWDGTSNLVVAVDENTASWYCTAAFQSTTRSGTRSLLYYSDGTNPNPSSPPTANATYAGTADIKVDYTPAVACSGTTVGGSAAASATTLCPGVSVALTTTGATVGTGLTYQWESSPTGLAGSWTAIAGETGTTMTIVPPAGTTTYYRRQITCTSTSSSAFSTGVAVSVSTATTVPYTETFESTSVGVEPLCSKALPSFDGGSSLHYGSPAYWRLLSGTYSGLSGDNHTPGGSKYLWTGYNLSTYSGGPAGQWFTPGINLSSGKTYRFSFWNRIGDYMATSWSGGADYTVYYNTSQSTTGWTAISSTFNVSTNVYKETVVDFTVPTSGVYYIAIQINNKTYTYYGGGLIDDVNLIELPPCTSATASTFSSGGKANASPGVICNVPGNTTLSVSGTPAFSGLTFAWEMATGTPTSFTATAGTSASYVQSITTGGTYYFRCKVTCAATGLSAYSDTAKVITTPITPPYIEDFESGTAGVNLPCASHTYTWGSPGTYWNLAAAPFSTSYPAINNHTPGGSKYIHAGYYLGTYGSGAEQWWFTPGLALTSAKAYDVSFWFNGSGYSSGNTVFGVGYGSSQTAAAMIKAGTDTSVNTTTYRQLTRSFIAPSTGTFYVGIKVNHTVYSYPGAAIDDIGITQLPPCSAKPTAGRAAASPAVLCTSSSTTTLSLSGASAASDLAFQWQESLTGVAGTWTNITGATAPSYVTTTPATMKWYRCYVICPLISAPNADTSLPFQVKTTPITPPYFEDFETGTMGVNMPCAGYSTSWGATTYWYLRDGDFNTVSYPAITNHTPGGSKYIHAGYILGSYSSGKDEYWFTPALALTASKAYNVSYWFNGSGYAGGATMTGVAVGTAQTIAGMTIPAGTDTTINTTTYRKINRAFISPTTGNYYVGIKVNNLVYSYPGVAIDDIGVDILPPCSAKPTAGTALCSPTMVCSSGSVKLSLAGTSYASDLTFQWYNVTTGTPVIIAGATSSIYTTPTLTTTQKYICVVTCPLISAPNTDTSSVVVVNVGAITPPYRENFETAAIGAINVPCAAVTNTFVATSRWYMYGAPFSTSYPAIINHTPGGSKYLFAGYTLGSYSLGANQFWFTPAIKFTAGETYEFSYWYNGSGYSSGSTNLGMYYGTAQTAAAMTTAIIPDKLAVNTTKYGQLLGRFVAPATGNYYIGLKVNHTAYSYPGIALDDIGLDQLPPCSGVPTAGAVSSTPTLLCSPGTVRLDMDYAGVSRASGLSYMWYSSTTGPGGYAPISSALTSPAFTTTTISTGTTFYCVVKCTLTGDSVISSVLKVDVGAITPPYIETFETVTPGTNAPCASYTYSWGSGAYWYTYGSPFSSSYPTMDNHTPGGSRYLGAGYYIGSYGSGADQYWFTPAIKFTAGKLYKFNFWYNGSGYAGGLTNIAAFMGTSQTAAAMTTAIGPALTGVNTLLYKEYKNNFTATGTGNYYIGIRVNNTVYSYPGIAIDDIGLQEVPPCSSPVVAGTIFADPVHICGAGGTTMLDLSGSTLATGLTYEWFSSSSATGPFTSTGTPTSSLPYTTDPLYSNTWFYCKITCSATGAVDSTPVYKQGVGGLSMPYKEDFESTAPSQKPTCSESTAGWGQYFLWNLQGAPYGTATNNTPGGKNFLLGGYYLGYYDYAYYGYTPLTHDNFWFTPGLDLNNRYKYQLTFWYQGASTANRMGVFYGKSQSVGGMTNTLRTLGNVSGTTYTKFDTTFKPATSGTYYVGFQKTTTAFNNYAYPGIAFDDINVNYAPCDGMPFAGKIRSSVLSGTALCVGTPMQLVDTGATIGLVPGIKFQWQRKSLGTGSPIVWTSIPGAKDTVLSGDTLIGYEYRLAVVCSNTNDTAFSPAFQLPALPPHPPVSISPSTTPVVYCLGDSVKLNATTFAGATYDWMVDSVVIPGWKFSDLGATEPGTYMVKVTSALSPCPGWSNKVKLVVNDPGYTVNITKPADSFICAGTSMTLFATSSKSGVTYQWRKNNVNIPGATSASYTVTTTGNYRVMASDGVSSCAAASRNILITVKPNPPAVITVPGGTTTACENEGVLLNANTGGFSYQWMQAGTTVVGMTDSSQLIKTSGVYSVKVRSADGCVSVSSPVTVNILPSPTPVIVKTTAGSIVTLSTTLSTYTSWQWIRNGSDIPGATSPTYVLSLNGYYRVRVTGTNNCEGLSDPILIEENTLSISGSSVKTDQIKIYPNPTHSKVYVESPVPVRVIVKDAAGKTVLASQETKEVDLSKFADGIYLFTISDKEGNELIKQQRVTKVSEK